MKENRIRLTTEQRKELEKFTQTGVRSARLIKWANIILALDISITGKAMKFEEIAKQEKVSNQTINNVRNAFFSAESVSTFLKRKKRETPPIAPKVTGDVEARIIALACGEAPEGYGRWTLKLLADRSVKLNILDSLSPATVGRLLKKRNLNLT